MNDNYFLIPISNENNTIYLFITQNAIVGDKNTVFVVVESCILKSRGNYYNPSHKVFLECNTLLL